jgi:hypothetical protein
MCCTKRHSKGSFKHHQPSIFDLLPCDDCEEKVSVLKCLECELNLCQSCSDDIHRKGSMRTHQSEGKFTIFSAATSAGSTVQDLTGGGNPAEQARPANGVRNKAGAEGTNAQGGSFSLAAPDSISLSFLEQASKPFTPMLGSGSMEPKTLWGAQGHSVSHAESETSKRKSTTQQVSLC